MNDQTAAEPAAETAETAEPAAETAPPAPPPVPPYVQYTPVPAQPKVRRTLGLPVVAAIAGATFVIGGLLGGIIGYAVHDDGPELVMRPGDGPVQRWNGPDGEFRQPQPDAR